MERQFDNRHPRHSQSDTWSHDRWSAQQGPPGGFDRWSNGSAYGAYNGELPCSILAVNHTQSLRPCQADRAVAQIDASTIATVYWDLLCAVLHCLGWAPMGIDEPINEPCAIASYALECVNFAVSETNML